MCHLLWSALYMYWHRQNTERSWKTCPKIIPIFFLQKLSNQTAKYLIWSSQQCMAKLEDEIRQSDHSIWFLNHFSVSSTSQSVSYYKSRRKAEKENKRSDVSWEWDCIHFFKADTFSTVSSKIQQELIIFVFIKIENFRFRHHLECLHFTNKDFEPINIHCPNIWMDIVMG